MVVNSDCLVYMKTMPDNSVDAIVTDPPYGLSFMGKKWDYDVPSQEIWEECLRVLKPGGYLLSFAGTRTQHRMAVRIEDAGFEIRDMIAWVYGSGFPKSLNIGKAVDKIQGNEREITGYAQSNPDLRDVGRISKENCGIDKLSFGQAQGAKRQQTPIDKGTSEWEGWGTALKPALEPITVARKPIEGNVAQNCLKWKVGGLNIDGSRVIAYNELNERPDTSNTNELSSMQKTNEGLEELFGKKKKTTNLLLEVQKSKYDGREKSNLEGRNLGLRKDWIQSNTSGQIIGKRLEINTTHNNQVLSGTQINNGETFKQAIKKRRDSSSYKREQEGQQNRELGFNELDRTREKSLESPERIINSEKGERNVTQNNIGRWPANLIHDGSDEVVGLFPQSKSTPWPDRKSTGWKQTSEIVNGGGIADSGSAARFFYCAKASKSERNRGCEELQEVQKFWHNNEGRDMTNPKNYIGGKVNIQLAKNHHPTVKPIALMEYLVKLVSKEGHTVLDPFMGSGSTGIACKKLGREFIGIEKEADYCKIAEARINAIKKEPEQLTI